MHVSLVKKLYHVTCFTVHKPVTCITTFVSCFFNTPKTIKLHARELAQKQAQMDTVCINSIFHV